MWYNLTLVNQGYERIRVIRGGKEIFKGAVPVGFSMELTIGDAVAVYVPKKGWIRKFKIVIWHNQPHIRFGGFFAKANLHISLDKLPHIPGTTWGGKLRKTFKKGGKRA